MICLTWEFLSQVIVVILRSILHCYFCFAYDFITICVDGEGNIVKTPACPRSWIFADRCMSPQPKIKPAWWDCGLYPLEEPVPDRGAPMLKLTLFTIAMYLFPFSSQNCTAIKS